MSREDYSWRAHDLAKELWCQLPKFVQKRLDPIFADPQAEEAGFALVLAVPNHLRGLVALWLYYRLRAGESNQAGFRGALDLAWSLDCRAVRGAADRRVLRSMFRYAAFPAPVGVSDSVEIWRGTARVGLSRARLGVSWTTNRDVACWFAWHFEHRNPLVIKATVAAADLAFPPNGQNEFKVIYFDGSTAQIDGDEADWQSAGQRWEDEKQTRMIRERLEEARGDALNLALST
jgi:hypothetical protein